MKEFTRARDLNEAGRFQFFEVVRQRGSSDAGTLEELPATGGRGRGDLTEDFETAGICEDFGNGTNVAGG